MCLGIASATAPDLFKPILFALSMVVSAFALWLLARSQWASFNTFHLRFRQSVVGVFVAITALAIVVSIVAIFQGQAEPEPLKVDSADYHLRANHTLLSNEVNNLTVLLHEATNQVTRLKLENQTLRETLIPKNQLLSDAVIHVRVILDAPSSAGTKDFTSAANVHFASGNRSILHAGVASIEKWPAQGGSNTAYVATCNMPQENHLIGKPLSSLSEADYIRITFGKVPDGVNVVGGNVVLILNGEIRIPFEVPPQKTTASPVGGAVFIRNVQPTVSKVLGTNPP